jgi:hypothetical protein|tara:strand:+ start:88 stop:297 length:210 start_codon:yes stop_codon:yes gene_type:complete
MDKEDQAVIDLQLDIEELEEILEKSAKRKNVKVLLGAWIEKLNSEKKKMDTILATRTPKKIDQAEVALN